MIPLVLAEVASESQARWSQLYYLYLTIAIIIGALVIGWLVTSLVKFRAREGEVPPPDAPRAGYVAAERGHVIWSWITALTIAVIMFGLAFSTIHAVDAVENPPPEGEHVYVLITGFQFGWKVNYTGPGGIPFQITSTCQDCLGESPQAGAVALCPTSENPTAACVGWYAPVDTVVVTNVTSQDVWHNWALPDFRIRVDAIPGETNHMWFRATEQGTVINQCVQICGAGHAFMKAPLHIVSKADFNAWLAKNADDAFARAARRGPVVNASFDGTTFSGLPASFPAEKPTFVNVTNAGAQAVTFSVDGGAPTASIPPGGYGHVYVPTHQKSVDITASNGAKATIPVVS